MQDMAIVNNGRGIEIRMRSMDGAIFNDLSDLARHRAASPRQLNFL